MYLQQFSFQPLTINLKTEQSSILFVQISGLF